MEQSPGRRQEFNIASSDDGDLVDDMSSAACVQLEDMVPVAVEIGHPTSTEAPTSTEVSHAIPSCATAAATTQGVMEIDDDDDEVFKAGEVWTCVDGRKVHGLENGGGRRYCQDSQVRICRVGSRGSMYEGKVFVEAVHQPPERRIAEDGRCYFQEGFMVFFGAELWEVAWAAAPGVEFDMVGFARTSKVC